MSTGSLVTMSSSCEHHHVNNKVSQSSSRVGAVEKSNSSGTREFTGGNTLGHEKSVFSGNVAPAVAEGGSLFPQLRGSIWQSCRQKVDRTVARGRFRIKNRKALACSGNRLEDEVGKVPLDNFWRRSGKTCMRL